MNIINEETFESNIQDHLVKFGGYEIGDASKFEAEVALDYPNLLRFIRSTQLDKWERLEEVKTGEDVEEAFLRRLIQELDRKGMLRILREGIDDYGIHFDFAYFKPESGLNPETLELYEKNILTVTRQVYFSVKNPDQSVDMVLFVNGLPVATIELKNPFTGQNVSNAKKQFMYTRDSNEMLFQFKKRALVHFAVDTEEVYMTTKLAGSNTNFLPFNKGNEQGAGNPLNPDGYKTAYFWEEVLQKDSWLDIIRRYVHLQEKEIKVDDKILVKETIIFPRYHQLDVVRKLTNDVKKNGVGKNYLIQHSAGSGKSNSIAWLAYRLSSLHKSNDERVFDSVVVVTDRIVLDKQLQDTIYQFDHVGGVVEKVDRGSDQLRNALQTGKKIIITTVQKFPYIVESMGELKSNKFAIIVDEAHSSQGGETSTALKKVLGEFDAETEEDMIRLSMQARGKQDNLSFFAFTATPKPKTLEVFGTISSDGKPRPFHLYSMRQAIEEGFILDVLKNYTTYKTFFKINKAIADDPEMNKQKTMSAIARFLKLHPSNLAQKAEIIVEHFRQVTMNKIGGQGKAMVVTSSRLHAYKYWQTFNKYLIEKKYTDIKTLVAFSGALTDPDTGEKVFETELNGFREKELPEKFSTEEYRILLVADKYQTGFDQPLLHTMYVDKKLAGVQAVQTLSRLNRTTSGKEDTFVLDFANEADEIHEAFQPYYELTTLTETTDPNLLYEQRDELDEFQLYTEMEVNNFSKEFFRSKQTKSAQLKLYAYIQPAIDRYKALNDEKEDKADQFKTTLTAFIRTYAFLAQVMPFEDMELEKLYVFCRLLRNALPKTIEDRFELNDEIALASLAIRKTGESSINLEKEGEVELDPLKTAGTMMVNEESAKLTEIVNLVNDKYHTDFGPADRLFIDQVEEDIIGNEDIIKQAKVNDKNNFKFAFDDALLDMLLARMEKNEDFALKFINDSGLRKKLESYLIARIYNKIDKEDISKLIKKGESSILEFKSTVRWDVKENKVNKDLEKIIIKTIVGFMNAKGGNLVIGVEDNGNVFGLEKDYTALNNADRDKFELHIFNLIKSMLGTEYGKYVTLIFDEIDEHDVCLVIVEQSTDPAFIKYQGKEEFYARIGNSTRPFSMSEAQKYIKNHWG